MVVPFIVALALCTSAGEDADATEQRARAVLEDLGTTPRPVFLEPVTEAPHAGDDARVKRFMGALAGGIVGAGLGLAMMPLGDSGCVFGGVCVTSWQSIAAVLTPLLALGGTWAGFQLLGGDAGLLATSATALPAGILAALMLLSTPSNALQLRDFTPFLIGSLAALVGLSSLALELRARQVEGLLGRTEQGSSPVGRVLLETLVTAGIAATTGLFLGLTGATCYGGTGCTVAVVSLGVLSVIGLAPTTWGLHKAMRGQGSLLSAFVGLLMAVGASAIVIPLSVGTSVATSSSIRSTAGILIAVESVAIGSMVMSSVALEWSHTEHVGSAGVQVSLSGGPIQGGAAVGAALRF